MAANNLLIENMDGIYHATLLVSRVSDGSFIDSLIELAENHPRLKLVLDFTNVEYISSAVIGKCVRISKAVEESHGRFAIVSANREITKVFEITKLSDRLHLSRDFSTVRADWL